MPDFNLGDQVRITDRRQPPGIWEIEGFTQSHGLPMVELKRPRGEERRCVLLEKIALAFPAQAGLRYASLADLAKQAGLIAV